MASTTILVVDDEELIRWSLTERLRAEGHDVLEAETGARALEQLREGVDLVLLDYKLPDLDGLTILKKIKEFDPDILVILLTAYASVDTAVEAMKEGAYHFANKPFNLDDVALLVPARARNHAAAARGAAAPAKPGATLQRGSHRRRIGGHARDEEPDHQGRDQSRVDGAADR